MGVVKLLVIHDLITRMYNVQASINEDPVVFIGQRIVESSCPENIGLLDIGGCREKVP